MGKQKGGNKLRRSSKKKPSYTAQRLRTARNKANQAAKRKRRKEHWKLVKEVQQLPASPEVLPPPEPDPT